MFACTHARMQPRLPGIVTTRTRSRRTGDKEPLQVRIPSAIKRQFKAHAALRGIEPNELFVEIWATYEASLHSTLPDRKIQK